MRTSCSLARGATRCILLPFFIPFNLIQFEFLTFNMDFWPCSVSTWPAINRVRGRGGRRGRFDDVTQMPGSQSRATIKRFNSKKATNETERDAMEWRKRRTWPLAAFFFSTRFVRSKLVALKSRSRRLPVPGDGRPWLVNRRIGKSTLSLPLDVV